MSKEDLVRKVMNGELLNHYVVVKLDDDSTVCGTLTGVEIHDGDTDSYIHVTLSSKTARVFHLTEVSQVMLPGRYSSTINIQ